jgi:hypothetical protein
MTSVFLYWLSGEGTEGRIVVTVEPQGESRWSEILLPEILNEIREAVSRLSA